MANDPNQDLKNKLGNEYDLYSSLKDKFQGFDSEGNAVFQDEGNVTSFNKKDFAKLNAQLQQDFGQKSYEDVFNKQQFEDIQKQGNKFQGFAGDQAIFRNEAGDLESFGSQGGFAKFLKQQQPGAKFDISQQGQSQRTQQGYQAGLGFLGQKQATQQKTGSGFTGYNPQARTSQIGKNIANPSAAQDDFEAPRNPNIPAPGSAPQKTSRPAGTFQRFQARQPQQKMTRPAEPTPPPTLGQQVTGMAKQAVQQKVGQETQQLKQQVQGEATQQAAGALGVSQQAITNPAEFAKQQAIAQAKQQYGGQAKQLASQYDPTGGALSGALEYKDVLSGNVQQNIQNLAKQQLKNQAQDQAQQYLQTLDPTGGYATAALTAGKTLFGGGSTEDKGRAAGEAAARMALTSTGIGALANPEVMQAGSALTSKLAQKAGPAGIMLKPTAAGLDLGATAGREAIGAAGEMGAGTARSFKSASEGLKSITSGNIEEGLKGLGSTLTSTAIQNFLKNPATIAKGIGNLGKAAMSKVSSAISSIFCFTPDTEILMADGKYKKIKQIKLGDKIMLGGEVTAIGQSTSDDLYYYDGVTVSGGHTLYENGTWKRVKDSKFAVKLDNKESLVYPMATENHLIVTKGQIWADIAEVDETYNKTDDDILEELNNQKTANKMIDLFIESYFKKKK